MVHTDKLDTFRFYLKNDKEKREYLVNEYYPNILKQLQAKDKDKIDKMFELLVEMNIGVLKTYDDVITEWGDTKQTKEMLDIEVRNHLHDLMKIVKRKLK